MTSNEIRASYLKFFEQSGHRVVASSPLVPADDPTLLFTNAGMNQFKDVFLGREKRAYTRAASSQKCVRAGGKHNDLDQVGRTARHLTFFEMLGNFSFGDYFKADAIRFAWQLLVEVYRLDVERLWFTVFEGDEAVGADDEAAALWVKAGASPDRVIRFGRKDNFWSMGDTGPCGPCTEIHYFRGDDLSNNVPALVNGPGDDTMEIWNLVFMQYDRHANGTLTPLPAPSVDTGAGLERMTSILQKAPTVYDIDSFQVLMQAVADLSGHQYGGSMDDLRDTAARVICDHARSTTFLLNDGVLPSNEGRGYVLRKIMRRAMRHGKHLGLTGPFLHRFVGVLAGSMGDAYPELHTHQSMVEQSVLAEEHRFEAVLADGLPRLEAEIASAVAAGGRTLSGEAAFRLYDTFGVPFDFIEDTAATQDVEVDKEGFELAMQGQRQRARGKSAFGSRRSEEFRIDDEVSLAGAGDQFEGYGGTHVTGVPIVALFDDERRPVEMLAEGAAGYAALARTPFYLEAGGQVSDTGRLLNEATGAEAAVEGLARVKPGLPRAHRVRVASGQLRVRDIVTAEVDAERRDAIRRNHTATHLLHAALRHVLGTHVKQAGSLVAPDRLRFDFVHFQAVTREELDRIERIVNEHVVRNAPVQTELRSTDEAIAAGAMALFGEKYGDQVRVVSVPGFSVELCGGTHVSATGDIGFFAILAESGVAAGTRRIEAVTGMGAVAWAQQQRAQLAEVIGALHVNPDQAVDAIERMQADTKRLTREVTQLRTKLAMAGTGAGGGASDADEAVEVAGVKLARRVVEGLDKDALRALADSLKAKITSGVVVLASRAEGRVQMVVAVTPDLTARLKAGQVVKELAPIVGGAGGGRPDFAEAGGKLPEKIDDMLAAAEKVIARLLTGART
jgi:alanyl-tRNA synthetase